MDLSTCTTRAAAVEAIAAEGLPTEIAEILIRESAPARHAWRVDQAYQAARAVVFPGPRALGYEDSLLIWAVLAADLVGVGGRDGCQGFGTVRLPVLSGLGKGRKQASDGPAWTAAIAEAANRVAEGDGGLYPAFVPHEDALAVHTSAHGMDLTIPVPLDLVPAAWQRSIAREGLRRAAGIGAWHPYVPIVGSTRVEHAELLAAWAAVVMALQSPADTDPAQEAEAA